MHLLWLSKGSGVAAPSIRLWNRPKWRGAHWTTFEPWLGIIKDLRTALAQDPLPLEEVKELLAA